VRFWSKVHISRSLLASAALLGVLVFGVGSASVAAVSSHASDGAFGQVTGRLVRVGGPAPGAAVGIPGRVVLSLVGTSGSFSSRTGLSGTFNVPVAAGFTYRVTGYSTKVMANGREELCTADRPVRVPGRAESNGSIVVRGIEVVCQIR
jgi:hypothetical protein